MTTTPIEANRLEQLHALQLLDTACEPEYDNLTQLAREICDVPVALISLVDQDRVWFKSRAGCDETQAPRSQSFCSHVVEHVHALVVQDASVDPRFQNFELVLPPQGIRFYAGVPLVLASGVALGSLCVMDTQAGTLSDHQYQCLQRLAVQVLALMEARRNHLQLLAQEKNHLVSEQRLAFALEAADIGDWDMDLQTNVARRSLLHDQCFGYTEPVPVWGYDTFLAHIFEADRDRVDDRYKRAMVGKGVYDVEFRVGWPDQTLHWLWSKGRFYSDDQGKPNRVAGILIDITERKQAEAALYESETRHRSMFENNPQPMWVYDCETLAFLSVNDATLAQYGYSREELLQMTLRDIRPAEEVPKLQERLVIDLQSRVTTAHLSIHQRKDGTRLQVEISAHAIDFQGRPARLVQAHDVTVQMQFQDEIHRLAFDDLLTGLPNRRHFLNHANQLLRTGRSNPQFNACILLDLDNFKRINDHWGHPSGDELLKQVALRIQQCIPHSGFLARLGGDEFAVLIINMGADQASASVAAQDICSKMLMALARGFLIGTREQFTSASLGIALFGHDEMTVDELLSRADVAMYSAKDDGRNAFRFFDGQLQARLAAQSELESDLRQCIQHDELHLVYQPQLDHRGHILGSEALLRWTHPQRGAVSPALFIPVAENSGLIGQIGQWVLHMACLTLAQWQSSAATAGLPVAVNVSAKQFHHPDFVSQVLSELELSGAPPQLLKLELTESLLAQDLDGIVQKMHTLKARGVTFSLDDFGTGYSSLAYLKRLPLDQLKIDQGFVRDVLVDSSDAAIVRTVIALGDRLGLNVIAEGVETQAHREFLESNGCYCYQGYLFSRPLKKQMFETFCATQRH